MSSSEVSAQHVKMAHMASRTVYSMLEDTARAHPEKLALQQPSVGGMYRGYTWGEFDDSVKCIAVGLSTIGAKAGTMIALQSETRAEFYLADFGVMALGAIAAALYTSLPIAEQAASIAFCEAKFALVEHPKVLRALQAELGDHAAKIQWILLR